MLTVYIRPIAALVTRPKLLLVRSVEGEFRFTRLNALFDSMRSAPVTRSVNLRPFSMERSTRAKPGPRNVFLPSVPFVPGAGRGKSAAVNTPVRNCCLLKPVRLIESAGAFGRSALVPSAL